MAPLRVMLVDDDAVARLVLERVLTRSAGFEVVGSFAEPEEALLRVADLRPDVVCTDYHMPGMDGLAFTRDLLRDIALPILVVSATYNESDIFKLLEAGAVEVIDKPRDVLSADGQKAREHLIKMVKVAAGVRVIRRLRSRIDAAKGTGWPRRSEASAPEWSIEPRIIVAGASTGGPSAWLEVLTGLSPKISVPVLCVQHISAGFLPGLVQWLDGACPLRVKIAEEGELPVAGTVYFAPDGGHLTLARSGRVHLDASGPDKGHRPSVTRLLSSAAACYGERTIGVVMTGMGDDGSEGLGEIRAAGGYTIAQDAASSLIGGMPARAVERGAAMAILPLAEIPMRLNALAERRPASG